MDIIKTVTDWPVIMQGALGSALFWAILEIGQRGLRRIATRLGTDRETANWFALAAHEVTDESGAQVKFICLYGALHYLLKGLTVTVLSWAVSPVLEIIATVGYLTAAYFFFRALAFVPHTSTFGPIPERRRRFQESLASKGGISEKQQHSTNNAS